MEDNWYVSPPGYSEADIKEIYTILSDIESYGGILIITPVCWVILTPD